MTKRPDRLELPGVLMRMSRNGAGSGRLPRGTGFLKNVLDGMQDWVRVINDAGAVIYMNHAMTHFLQNNPDADVFFKAIGNAPVPDVMPLSIAPISSPYPGRFLFDGGRSDPYGWRSRGDFVRTVDIDVDVNVNTNADAYVNIDANAAADVDAGASADASAVADADVNIDASAVANEGASANAIADVGADADASADAGAIADAGANAGANAGADAGADAGAIADASAVANVGASADAIAVADIVIKNDGTVKGGALVEVGDRSQPYADMAIASGLAASDSSAFVEYDEMRVADKEIRIGKKVYAVISSPLVDKAGDNEYTVEVFRDVTRLKNLQHKITEQNQKFEYDLDMAKMLQRRLLPTASPNARIGFQYVYRPCDMLGGDFVDIYNIGEDHLGVYIADVSGHGVSASVLTVFLRSTISKRMTSPAAALNALYREYNSNNFEPEVYITVFYAIFDFKSGSLTYANAGHNAIPALYNKARLENPRFLRIPGVPISNWVEHVEYSEKSERIEPGDMLFMYTDGLLEMKNKEKEMFGPERIHQALSACKTCDTSVMLLSILRSAFRFAGIESKSMLADDVTMSFVEVK